MVNRERLVSTFLEMVRLDNPSWREDAVAEYASRQLRSLGFAVTADAAGNLIGRLSGEGPPFMLSCHLDSVVPCVDIKPVVDSEVIRSDGTTVLGADDRAGIAAVFEGLRSVIESNEPRRSIEVVFTRAEEIGLQGAKALDRGLITAKQGLALDASGRIGLLVVSAPAQNAMRISIRGRAAHAGVAPEEGISAILVASRAIASLPLGRLDSETTANIGTIKAGTAPNIVPEFAEIEAEARSREDTKLLAQTELMVRAFEKAAHEAGATAQVVVQREYSAFNLQADSPTVQLVRRALEQVGVQAALVASGGGSDANVFNNSGIEVAVMSVGFTGAHTLSEELHIPDLVQAAGAVAAIVRAG